MVSEIFQFSYTWEVYKPKEKREYGYYVLPVLFKDKFIARTDMKLNRKTGELSILGWWWEENVEVNSEIEHALENGFISFLKFLGDTGNLNISALSKKDKTLFYAISRRLT
jgi:uncharacterized protein YcaQ